MPEPTPEDLFAKAHPGNTPDAEKTVLAYLERDGNVDDDIVHMLVRGYPDSDAAGAADTELQKLIDQWFADAGKKRPAPVEPGPR